MEYAGRMENVFKVTWNIKQKPKERIERGCNYARWQGFKDFKGEFLCREQNIIGCH